MREDLLNKLHNDDYIAVDIETACNVQDCEGYGGSSKCRHALDHNRNKITCIGVYHGNVSSGRNDEYYEVHRSISSFNSCIEDMFPDTPIVGHNFKFDCKSLLRHGATRLCRTNWYSDSQLSVHVSTRKITRKFLAEYELRRSDVNKMLPRGYSHRKAGDTSLKTNAPYWLNVEPFWEDPTNHDNDEYVIKDCKYTWLLFKTKKEHLIEDGEFDFLQDRMMPWAHMLLESELRGVPFDEGRAIDLKTKLIQESQELEAALRAEVKNAQKFYIEREGLILKQKYKKMCEAQLAKLKDDSKIDSTKERYNNMYEKALAKVDANLNFDSPKQMLWMFQDYYNLKCERKVFDQELGKYVMKTGVGVEVLTGLADKHPAAKLLLDLRAKRKLLGYIDAYMELVYEGRIHPTYNLAGTRTGRLSASDPNLQQVNSELYPLFHNPNKMLVCYDLSGIEAMLIAVYSNDKALYEILSKGESLHDHNTKDWFELKTPINEVKKEHGDKRQCSKGVGFSLFYGAGANRIKSTLEAAGFAEYAKNSKRMHERFKKRFAGAVSYHKRVTTFFEEGNKLFNITGRPIKIQDPEEAYMKAFNRVIQSSGSDLCMLAAYNYVKNNCPGWPVLFVHDCIGLEVDIEEAGLAEKKLIECMTNFKLNTQNGPLKLQVEGGKGHEWVK